MTTTLDLGGIELPLLTVTEPNAILGVRGSGKSNTAVRLAEQMHAAGLPWVAVDPKGDWYGIRSSADGEGAGLPIPVLGGLHGDLPLEPTAGKLIADLIVDRNLTVVLDVSDFGSKNKQVQFLTDFAEQLFRRQGRDPHPRHLFLDEADDFVPQMVRANMARCVGAWTKIVKQGRSRGLGVTLITQRSASLNKDALTQAETLIAMRTTSPQDRKAILGWVDYWSVGREIVDSLPSLASGEGWVCSPHFLGRVERVQFAQRTTFDSGRTPEVGVARAPASLADVDLDALRTQMADTIEKQQATDPKALLARVRELEGKLRDLERRPAEVVTAEVRVEVAPSWMAASLDQVRADTEAIVANLFTILGRLESDPPQPAPPRVVPKRAVPQAAPQAARTTPAVDGGEPLGKVHRAILGALAQYPEDGRTARQVALLTGYSSKGGGFRNALSRLRTLGLIERGDPIRITPEGQATVGHVEPLPTGEALLEVWLGNLSAHKACRVILEALARAGAAGLDLDALGAATGYEIGGGGFRNSLSRLRTLELISPARETPIRIADEFLW